MFRAAYSLIGILFLANLVSCDTLPPVPESSIAGKYKNACLPEAIVMTRSLQGASVQAKVLAISTSKWNHAVTAYMYPPGENRLYVWDSYWKSIRVRAYFNSAESVAKAWLLATRANTTFISAEFIE